MFRNLEAAVMVTYRCNARCQMCNIWASPSQRQLEITAKDLEKLPTGHIRINIGGGEPMLRSDIEDIVAVLDEKTDCLEISTNGYFTDRLVSIGRKYPDILIRVSLEGLPKQNDEIRGIKDGFDHGLRTILRLREIGVKNIGFGITLWDKSAGELLDLYHLAVMMDVEFAQSIVHDAWQFRKPGIDVGEREFVAEKIKKFIRELLSSKRRNLRLRAKDWVRAYLNRGFLEYLQGNPRLLPCGAGTNIYFVDPYGEIFPCNALELSMGNIREKTFEEIWNGPRTNQVRDQVAKCTHNCWMTGTSRPAMRKAPWKPIAWILRNKVRLFLGKDICW